MVKRNLSIKLFLEVQKEIIGLIKKNDISGLTESRAIENNLSLIRNKINTTLSIQKEIDEIERNLGFLLDKPYLGKITKDKIKSIIAKLAKIA